MGFTDAVQLLTIFPVGRPFRVEGLRKSVLYFPIVGLLLGAVLAGLDLAFAPFLEPMARSFLLVGALVVMTGALHLDGVGDTADASAGHRTVERRLEIMKDSRVGAFGVIAIVLVITTKAAFLASVPAGARVPALILMPTIARWAPVYAARAHKYARAEGLGSAIHEGASIGVLVGATVIVLAAALAAGMLGGVAVFAAAALIVAAMSLRLARLFDGLTGDCYGSLVETAEIAVLLGVIVAAKFGFFPAGWW